MNFRAPHLLVDRHGEAVVTPILALDLATRTGWALRDASGVVTSGVQTFDARRGESAGMRFLRFRAWLRDMFALGAPALVAWERAHHRGGHATALAVGLTTEVLTACAARGVEHTAVHTATLKKDATGNGRASKADMVMAARIRWDRPGLVADDEADALCVLAWAIDEIGERTSAPRIGEGGTA